MEVDAGLPTYDRSTRRTDMRLSIVGAALLMAGSVWAEGKAPAAAATVGKGNMMHCPTSVNGAKVAQQDIKDGVEITVTADNEKATTEIRQRSQHLVEA